MVTVRFVRWTIVVLLIACLTHQHPTTLRVEDARSVESCFLSKAQKVRERVVSSKATSVARRHSQNMAADRRIYHNDDLAQEMSPFAALGENVGMGPSCSSIHDAFMASDGHRANLEDSDFKQIGIGVTIRDDTIYVTEVFVSPAESESPVPSKKQPAPKPKVPKPSRSCQSTSA